MMRRTRKTFLVSLSGLIVTLIFVLRLLYAGNRLPEILPSALILSFFVIIYPMLRDIAPRKFQLSHSGVANKKGPYYVRIAGTYVLIPLSIGLIYYFFPPPSNLNLPLDVLLLLATSLILVLVFTGREANKE